MTQNADIGSSGLQKLENTVNAKERSKELQWENDTLAKYFVLRK